MSTNLYGTYLGNMTNETISDLVLQKMPKNTFTSVKTYKITNHFFADGSGYLAGRKIILKREEVIAIAWQTIKTFFCTLFGLSQHEFNENSIQNYLLGIDGGSINGHKEIQAIFKNCKTLNLYISEDGQHVDSELLDEKSVVIARTMGKALRLGF